MQARFVEVGLAQVGFTERPQLQIVDRGRQPAGDGITAPERVFPKEQVKHGLPLRQAGLPVPGRHRELIEVGEQTQRSSVDLGETRHGRRLEAVDHRLEEG